MDRPTACRVDGVPPAEHEEGSDKMLDALADRFRLAGTE
jgi:hypothetical protein